MELLHSRPQKNIITTMAGKWKAAIPKTSLRGKHLKINIYKLGKNRTHRGNRIYYIT